MSEISITLEPMDPKYNHALIQLLMYEFRNKFKKCQNLSDEQLTFFFQKRLDSSFAEPFSCRMIALCDDKVIGTLCLRWKPEFDESKKQNTLFSKEMVQSFGKWDFFKLALSLHLVEHAPSLQECYIADVLVHAEHLEQGIETALVQWAYDFAKNDPRFDLLTLHVADKNKDAARLYGKFFFKTCLQKSSLMRALLFDDSRWNFMTLPLK